tara:strand:+ start:6536 stop:7351 length:816 start_codon:yes stop_codon:yes gene_type:complete
MYDFYFGTKKEILENDEEFLIFVKRLMPRWVNGIPDSEYLDLYRNLKKIKKKKPIIIETGSGASSLVFFFYAAINNGSLFSWDTNGSKGSFLGTIMQEAICRPLKIDINKHWNFIAFDSTDEIIGIPLLKELKKKASFGFFDSLHTLEHLMKEIKLFEEVADKEFFIGLDDAYFSKKYKNYGFINMIRKKLELDEVKEPKDNISAPFYEVIKNHLKENNKVVKEEELDYKKNYKSDLYLDYYSIDKKVTNKMNMEDLKQMHNRLKIWLVKK